jgi:hypothetical protein
MATAARKPGSCATDAARAARCAMVFALVAVHEVIGMVISSINTRVTTGMTSAVSAMSPRASRHHRCSIRITNLL